LAPIKRCEKVPSLGLEFHITLPASYYSSL
jgi:hypothetical protein